MSDKLPIAPTTETLKSLIRANLFINHAKQHALSENEFDTMISIHNLDNAIEYTLRILIRHLQIQERTGRTINSCELAQLIGEIQRFIKDEYNESLSFVQELKMIRDLRNLAQHAMIVPTSEVSTYLSYATSFFERTLEKFFGISTEKLKYSSVIRCNEVKELLNEAENCIDRCKFLEAIVNCRDAFDYANFLYNNDSIQRITRAPAFSELRMKNNKLYQYLLDLDRRVSLDILKTDISQYLHYMEYINCIPFEYQANWVGNTVLMRDWEIKDAEFCYLFVSQSIMQWERNCREPIQESCVSEEHQVEFVDEICEVSATAVFPSYGCQYLFENEEARLFYCDKTGFDRLKNCLKKNVVTITEKKLKGSCIQTHTLHYANVVHFDIQLVMNSLTCPPILVPVRELVEI